MSGDCCLWGINAQEESILGVKLVGWKIQEEKVLGGKNLGERWGPAGKTTFKHITRNPTKNQNFSKILFAFFQLKPEASKSYMKHFSICNIKGAEKFSWSLPVHLFQESLV